MGNDPTSHHMGIMERMKSKTFLGKIYDGRKAYQEDPKYSGGELERLH